MEKFTEDSFEVINVTDIPRECLLEGVLNELSGRETFKDDEFNEQVYCGDVFETIEKEWSELFQADVDNAQIFRITQEMIDQVKNLSEVIKTELVRVISH